MRTVEIGDGSGPQTVGHVTADNMFYRISTNTHIDFMIVKPDLLVALMFDYRTLNE